MSKVTYIVTIPIAGAAHIEVRAPRGKSKDELFELAVEKYNSASKRAQRDMLEWEWCDPISEGNVLHAPVNEMSIEVVE